MYRCRTSHPSYILFCGPFGFENPAYTAKVFVANVDCFIFRIRDKIIFSRFVVPVRDRNFPPSSGYYTGWIGNFFLPSTQHFSLGLHTLAQPLQFLEACRGFWEEACEPLTKMQPSPFVVLWHCFTNFLPRRGQVDYWQREHVTVVYGR